MRGGQFLGPVCVRQGTANGRAFAGKRSRKTKNDQGCVAFRGGCGSFVAQSLSFSVFGCSVSPRSHTVCVCLCLCGLVDEVERWRGVRVACSSEGSPKKRMARAQEEARNHSRRLSRVKRGKKKTEWGKKGERQKKTTMMSKGKEKRKQATQKRKTKRCPSIAQLLRSVVPEPQGSVCSAVQSCRVCCTLSSSHSSQKKLQKERKEPHLFVCLLCLCLCFD